MKSSNKIVVLSLPRCGSSLLTSLIESANYKVYTSKDSRLLGSSCFNKNGYFEDRVLTLLNDQIIRGAFGNQYSFLYMPDIQTIQDKFKTKDINSNYFYDLDDIFIPNDYLEHIKEYTGSDYDIWAITRMLDNGKWNKCYSRNNVASYNDIGTKIKEISDDINSSVSNLVLKDPRLNLTLPFFNFSNDIKYIFLTRKKSKCIDSMRRHYGKWLFTETYLDDTDICSNYFNFKIKYQDFDAYYQTYNDAISYALAGKSYITITYEDILDKNLTALEEFIKHKVNGDLIQ
jgi:hypothetical protein